MVDITVNTGEKRLVRYFSMKNKNQITNAKGKKKDWLHSMILV